MKPNMDSWIKNDSTILTANNMPMLKELFKNKPLV